MVILTSRVSASPPPAPEVEVDEGFSVGGLEHHDGAFEAAACELLGIDPLYAANEGKSIAVVAREEAEAALAALRSHPPGGDPTRIGEIHAEPPGIVVLRTTVGGYPHRRHARRRLLAPDLLSR